MILGSSGRCRIRTLPGGKRSSAGIGLEPTKAAVNTPYEALKTAYSDLRNQ